MSDLNPNINLFSNSIVDVSDSAEFSQISYFPFLGANSDGARLLQAATFGGSDAFGFEDLPTNIGGVSDNDFNDAIPLL
ncbi:MAG: DUF4114 domain-containing protein [Prochloraceae cyanobacterium]|nr:DUF4114 domain-containing protein [Prochloraceae cyanobacterium]